MSVVRNVFRNLGRIRSLKYIVVLAVGVALIGFVGSSSVVSHIGYLSRISELQAEIDHYDGEYRRDQAQIRQLQNNPKAMERIARERYFMKMADEDIFVLSDDERQPQSKAPGDETVE